MSLPQLSLTPHTPASIPSDLSLFVKAGSELLESFPSPSAAWRKGKTHGSVETFVRKKQKGLGVGNDAFWAARKSVHPSADYDVFRHSLLHNHTEHEHLYISTTSHPPVVLSTVPSAPTPPRSPSSAWLLNYSMPTPLNPRHFLILLVGEEIVSDEEFVVVSIPWEPSEEGERKLAEEGGKGVRGRYCAVERVRKRKEGGVEWVMATCSTPAGWVPQFLTDRSVAGEVAKDVPLFLEWVEKGRPGI